MTFVWVCEKKEDDLTVYRVRRTATTDLARVCRAGDIWDWMIYDPRYGGRCTAYGKVKTLKAAKVECERLMRKWV